MSRASSLPTLWSWYVAALIVSLKTIYQTEYLPAKRDRPLTCPSRLESLGVRKGPVCYVTRVPSAATAEAQPHGSLRGAVLNPLRRRDGTRGNRKPDSSELRHRGVQRSSKAVTCCDYDRHPNTGLRPHFAPEMCTFSTGAVARALWPRELRHFSDTEQIKVRLSSTPITILAEITQTHDMSNRTRSQRVGLLLKGIQ